ncbi:type III glutamate--ammonia ligase [Nocardia jiangsuensis]|uniref:Type III glutamate--ammonia ligase n=1 Tax=Nocardia jiangsuensis TaxID=1691563 RepID=A0ABV8DUF3_9NOCA
MSDTATVSTLPTSTPPLRELAAESGTTFVLALFTTLSGKPCAKLVPVQAIDQLERDGVGFAGYAAGMMGQEPRDPDLVAVPDPASFTPIPFVRPGLALVHCTPHVEGEAWPFAPRVILQRTLARAAAMGYAVNVGAEIEYFLVDRASGKLTTADAADVSARPCYDARDVTRMYDHLTEISTAMNALGWGNYASDHEDGNGQFEQNFDYADAMTTADRVITARYLLSVIAEKRGMTATFMPKPFTDRTGSGMHLHLSLWRGDTALFPGTDPQGLGLSPLAYSFVAGILDHACALQGVIAPTVNSYKRTGATSTASGATWSPRRATYGGNDRTHFLRVPDGNRVELRGADGSANPYLAAAATIAAGLDGVERAAHPGPLGAGAAADLPMTLVHAMDALEADPVLTAALDVAGPGVAAYFAQAKREEFFAWHNTVSDWEIDHYLTAF